MERGGMGRGGMGREGDGEGEGCGEGRGWGGEGSDGEGRDGKRSCFTVLLFVLRLSTWRECLQSSER